jgi:hypothetical protein
MSEALELLAPAAEALMDPTAAMVVELATSALEEQL